MLEMSDLGSTIVVAKTKVLISCVVGHMQKPRFLITWLTS